MPANYRVVHLVIFLLYSLSLYPPIHTHTPFHQKSEYLPTSWMCKSNKSSQHNFLTGEGELVQSSERLHVISTHTKFEDVSTNTSIFRAYNVHLLFSENFENFFPTFGRNDPSGAKMGRVWSKPKVPKNPQGGTRKGHQSFKKLLQTV